MKKTTISDIAKETGVSKSTVSLVLNNKPIRVSSKTRESILRTSKELNYIPNAIARSLSTNKTETIGIILPDIVNPFFAEIARAIEDTAGKMNYNVMLCNSDSNIFKEEKYAKLLVSKSVSGSIFISGGDSKRSLEILKTNDIPLVLVDRYVELCEDYSGVFCSNKEGIYEAVNYLYSKNRRNIALVTGTRTLETSKLRLQAFREVTEKFHIYNKNLICEGSYSIEGGVSSTEKLLQSNNRIDSIIYCSDVMAFGGIKVLKRKNFNVPKDVSVIGYDDISLCEYIEPELTTIRQPIYEMGKEACKLLLQLINGETTHKRIDLKSKLIIRGTA